MQRKSIFALAWGLLSQLSTQSISAIFSLLIARFLGPESYGIFASVNLIYLFSQVFTIAGADKILIQRPVLTSHLTIYFAVITTVLSTLVATIATLYLYFATSDHHIVVLSLILGVSCLISSHTKILDAILQRNLKIKQLAKKNTYSYLFSGFICLLLASKGFGIYALGIQSLLGSFISFSLIFKISTSSLLIKRPKFRTKYLFAILKKSSTIAPVQMLSLSNRESSRIFVSLFMGPYYLGLLTGAQKIISIIQNLVAATINKTAYPIICELRRSNTLTFGANYLKISSMSVVSITYFFIMTYLLADTFTSRLLGVSWMGIFPFLPPLLLSGWLTSISWLNNVTMFAVSLEQKQIYIGLMRLIVGITFLMLFADYGLVAVCLTGAVRSIIVDPFQAYFLCQKLKVNLLFYFSNLKYILLSGTICTFLVALLKYTGFIQGIIQYILAAIMVSLFYFAIILFIDRNVLANVKSIMRSTLRKGSPSC